MSYVLNDVLIGDDGWLFTWQGTNRIHDILQGKKALTDKEIQAWKKELQERHSFCHVRNAAYHFLIIPLKQCLFEEKLPDCSLSPFRPALQLHAHTLAYYPLEFLKELKQHAPIYYRYDTHWNDFACNALYASLLKQNPKAALKEYIGTPLHDLWIKISKDPCPPERCWHYEQNNIVIYNEIENAGGFIFCENPNHSQYTCVIFGDSFSRFCINTVSQYFRHVFFFHTTGFDRHIIDNLKPDAVINCQAENFIHSLEKIRFNDYFETLLYKFLISGKNSILQNEILKTYALFMDPKQIRILQEIILLFAKNFSLEQILAHLCQHHGINKEKLKKLLAFKKTP